MEVLKELLVQWLPWIALVVVMSYFGFRVRRLRLDSSGPGIDWEKKESPKDRARVQTSRQIRGVQIEIEQIRLIQDMGMHMGRATDELEIIRGSHETAFKGFLSTAYPDHPAPHKTDEFALYQLIWDHITIDILEKIRESIDVNGFHDYSESMMELYAKKKLRLFWGIATHHFDIYWSEASHVSRGEIALCGGQVRDDAEESIVRLYKDMKRIRQENMKEIEKLKDRISELENDLRGK